MTSPHRRSRARFWIRVTALGAAAALIGFASPAMAGVDTVSDVPHATTTFNGECWSEAIDGNTIFVGGAFTKALITNKAVARGGLAAVDAVTGDLLPWAPTVTGGVVKAMAVSGGIVYIGGNFTTVNGVAADHIAALDETTGALVSTFSHHLGGEVRAFALGNGLLYAGGTFTTADGLARGYLAAFDLTTGALSTTWAPTADAHVNGLWFGNNQVYIAGLFTHLNGASNTRLRAVDPTTGAVNNSFKPVTQYEVQAVTTGASGVYAAVAGPGGRVQAFTTAGAGLWTITTDGNTNAVAVMDQTVYAGGHFDNVCKTANTGTHGLCIDGSTPRGKFFATDLSGNLLDFNPAGDGIWGTHQLIANPTLHTVDAVGSWPHLHAVNHHGFAIFG
jgi:hypothetical protein